MEFMFVIHLADGRQIPVRSREFMASAPNGRTIVVYQPDSTAHVIDLLLVTGLELKLGGNGASGENIESLQCSARTLLNPEP